MREQEPVLTRHRFSTGLLFLIVVTCRAAELPRSEQEFCAANNEYDRNSYPDPTASERRALGAFGNVKPVQALLSGLDFEGWVGSIQAYTVQRFDPYVTVSFHPICLGVNLTNTNPWRPGTQDDKKTELWAVLVRGASQHSRFLDDLVRLRLLHQDQRQFPVPEASVIVSGRLFIYPPFEPFPPWPRAVPLPHSVRWFRAPNHMLAGVVSGQPYLTQFLSVSAGSR